MQKKKVDPNTENNKKITLAKVTAAKEWAKAMFSHMPKWPESDV